MPPKSLINHQHLSAHPQMPNTKKRTEARFPLMDIIPDILHAVLTELACFGFRFFNSANTAFKPGDRAVR